MKRKEQTIRPIIFTLASAALLGGCAATSGTGSGPTPPYADGSKSLSTPDLSLDATFNGSTFGGSTATSLKTIPVTIKTTSDTNRIYVTADGRQFELIWDSASNGWKDTSGNSLGYITETSDNQAQLDTLNLAPSGGQPGLYGYVVRGLETDPAQIAALAAGSGTASYTNGYSEVYLKRGSSGIYTGWGYGDASLTADLSGGTITGTLTINFSPDSTIPSGSIMNVSGTISGNSISGTVTPANPANFKMNSASSSSLTGKFYGVNAADIGGTFSGTGVYTDGSTPVYYYGGFVAD